jgi:hypothetical protein
LTGLGNQTLSAILAKLRPSGAMVLVMLEPAALAWILLLPVIAGSVFADAFDWLPVRPRWVQLTLVLGASVKEAALELRTGPQRNCDGGIQLAHRDNSSATLIASLPIY